MPLFDFKCELCGETLELLVTSDITTAVHCVRADVDCEGLMRKQISGPGGFILIGDGFYKPSRGK